MDIAKKKTGEWIIMEPGDGQFSGLPDILTILKKLSTNDVHFVEMA